MPASSKVQFNLEALREQALQSLDERITLAQAEVDSLVDESSLAEKVGRWRADQEQRISDLFRQLDSIDDYRLSNFRVEPMPEISNFDRGRAERRLNELKSKRSQIVAKSNAVVPDADGNVSLTKTQLEEYFGL